ncbi:hypothetical protein F8A10_10460 [Paracoccus kondratievae]|uniref:hypothetical protein n=1 Tax=Paracoccus kondratievae TaxID=135740 RepID=UPI00126653E0|nr:hypothetical protein [Paracoccus kondratievae]QFQ87817.1 hypothetical protein F8A10_10460 [Paracoccus kondratievae]
MRRQKALLAGLERIARLKADLEMQRLAVLRTHVGAAERRVAQLKAELDTIYRTDTSFTLAGARLANALAGEYCRALLTAEQELAGMLPGYELARQAAAREFGRAEAVRALQQRLASKPRADQGSAQP